MKNRSLVVMESDTSFKLFKKAGSNAPEICQPAAKKYLEPVKVVKDKLNSDALKQSLQAMQEMLGQSDAAQSDLQTSFSALAKEPDSVKKLSFVEERVKTWVSEVIEGQDGLERTGTSFNETGRWLNRRNLY